MSISNLGFCSIFYLYAKENWPRQLYNDVKLNGYDYQKCDIDNQKYALTFQTL